MNDQILENYQIRKSNKEKDRFIGYLKERLSASGYDPECDITVEEKWKGIFLTRNIIVGDPDKAKVLLTAHYDTCALLPFPNLMAPTSPFLFIAYQLFLVVMIFLVATIPAVIAGFFTEDPMIIYYVFELSLILFLVQVMFGFKNRHAANDNTSGVVTLTRFLERLPEEQREKVCVIFFDNEEKGLFGSMHFAEKHKDAAKNTLMINLDCVGDGETIVSLAKKEAMSHELYHVFAETMEQNGTHFDGSIQCRKMLPMMFPSDQSNFKKGIGVCALNKSPLGMYCARIHTPKDTVCREENVKVLAETMAEFVEKV